MEKMIGKKRYLENDNPESEYINNKSDNTISNNKFINDKSKDTSMNKLIDECFNDFIKGNTNKLLEDCNLLKQKFYESIS